MIGQRDDGFEAQILNLPGFHAVCLIRRQGRRPKHTGEREWAACRAAVVPSRDPQRGGNQRQRQLERVDEALGREPGLAAHAVNCAGLLSLDEFIALLERSSLFLTSDSGPMHIAASVGTPLVALFGPEAPRSYGPLGDSHVIYKGISCSPCLNIYNAKLFVCPYHARCMNEILTREVVSAVRQLLPALRPEPT